MFVLAASADSSMMLDATIFLGAAVILIPLAKRFGIATVLGYLFTGLLLGPSFLKVAGNPDDLLHFGYIFKAPVVAVSSLINSQGILNSKLVEFGFQTCSV